MRVMGEQVAMIEKVGVGRRDGNRPVLWFDVKGDGWASLQVFRLDDEVALDLLSAVHESHDLNGRACVVDRHDGNLVRFVRLLPAAVH